MGPTVTATSTAAGRPTGDDMVTTAAANAREAASAAGTRIVQLTKLAEFDESLRLYDSVWHADDGESPVSRDLLRALSTSGSYVAGAYDRDGMVAASFTVFHPPADQAMHSHIVGVAPRGQGRGVGFALKLDQRAWALPRGVTTITWTFDPLVRRNAYFNVAKLAAAPTRYVPDFYGSMDDALNGDDASDRLLVAWDLTSPQVVSACCRTPRPVTPDYGEIAVGLGISAREHPVPGKPTARVTSIAIPGDIEGMRRRDPELAADWRVVVRATLGSLLEAGGKVIGFDRQLGYLVEQAASSSS
jgi:predicted GNAT superfamily acetyltransferase